MRKHALNQDPHDKPNPPGQNQQPRNQPSGQHSKANGNKQQQDLPAVGEAGKAQQ